MLVVSPNYECPKMEVMEVMEAEGWRPLAWSEM